jgi:hypothetical protein
LGGVLVIVPPWLEFWDKLSENAKRWFYAIGISTLVIAGMLTVFLVIDDLRSKDVPIGTVIAWYGPLKDKPRGYELCDGGPTPSNSALRLLGWETRPNLRGRFLRMAENEGTALSMTDGGHDFVSLAHTHPSGSYYAEVGFAPLNDSVPNIHIIAANRAATTFSTSSGGYDYASNPLKAPQIISGSKVAGDSGQTTFTGAGFTADGRLDNRPAYREVWYLIKQD